MSHDSLPPASQGSFNYAGALVRLKNPELMPCGCGFAWDAWTVATCAHIQPQTSSMLFNCSRSGVEIDYVVSFTEEDIAFVVCKEPHGFHVFPPLEVEPEPDIALSVCQEYTTEQIPFSPLTGAAETTGEIAQPELYFSRRVPPTKPNVWTYQLQSATPAGASGSPVMTKSRAIAAMHVGMNTSNNMGYGISMLTMNQAFQRMLLRQSK